MTAEKFPAQFPLITRSSVGGQERAGLPGGCLRNCFGLTASSQARTGFTLFGLPANNGRFQQHTREQNTPVQIRLSLPKCLLSSRRSQPAPCGLRWLLQKLRQWRTLSQASTSASKTSAAEWHNSPRNSTLSSSEAGSKCWRSAINFTLI